MNRCNYVYFIKEARNASIAINELLMEIPWKPNPEYWSYTSQINPREYDIVNTSVMYFDGFIKLENVIKKKCECEESVIYTINYLEDILINASFICNKL